MKEYHKIQTVYKRDPDNNFKTLLQGQWSLPEFNLLKDIEWEWTEKIDGTNIRIMWDGEKVRFGGKTDNAQIPTILIGVLQDAFTHNLMSEIFPNATDTTDICLYGEGYGMKIQKGGNYIPDKADFVLFDVKIGDWWLRRDDVTDIAEQLGISTVPIIGYGTLEEAVVYCKEGFKSTIATNKDYDAEGLVMRPRLDLFSRNGSRIIAKIKQKDFA